MVPGLLGKKLGMTQVWDAQESARAATVVQLGPCVVLQVKTPESDGYSALQLGFGDRKFRRKHGKGERRRAVERRGAKKPEIGHCRKANASPKCFVREVLVEPGHEFKLGQELGVGLFDKITHVDVIGTTKGKGFQGTVKRHHFHRGPVSHGSMNVRQPGAIGSNTWPGRVIPGKRMSGHMGDERHTEQNLHVLKIDPQRNLMLLNGAVPGADGGYVIIKPAGRLLARKKS
jgi:large subunit ribosomal protein L3